MMSNLFSMFDPSASYMDLSWCVISLPLIFMQMKYKKMGSKWNKTISMLMSKINSEMGPILGETNKKGTKMMMMSIFMVVLATNTMAMTPYTFNLMAQISITLPMAMVMWSMTMLMGWKNHTKKMMAHCLPMGTPVLLMNFLVVIELVSNIIRPITLAVRMTANMVAGHLLLSLLANYSMTSVSAYLMTAPLMMIMVMLEIAVSVIQSYVLTILISLYSTEIH